jgi:hypothetical protein
MIRSWDIEIINPQTNKTGIIHSRILTWGKVHTYRVPNLKLDWLAVNCNHPCPKFHTDGQIMDRLKPLICELQEQTWFPHPWFAKNKGNTRQKKIIETYMRVKYTSLIFQNSETLVITTTRAMNNKKHTNLASNTKYQTLILLLLLLLLLSCATPRNVLPRLSQTTTHM